MTTQTNNTNIENQTENMARRIDAIGWALFFVMIGCLWMVPAKTLPESTWLVGVGLIMLGSNAARRVFGLGAVGWTLVVGLIALAAGVSGLFGVALPVFPILIVICGLSTVIGALRKNNNASQSSN
ncbi:MAG: hypothetical protein GY854_29200 [Deltaproteobacteria bacterium]|nr:hypothetical protein [Deltaproteobacteria bacterium]